MRTVIRILTLFILTVQSAAAQDRYYMPRDYEHEGDEYVAVVIGSSGCGWSTLESFMEVIDPMLRDLQRQAHERGYLFTAIGVAVDQASSGLEWLQQVANFDEVAAGNLWLNTGLREYVWEYVPGEALTPSLVLLRRSFSSGLNTPRGMQTEVLQSIVAANEIIAFARNGAPLPD